MYTKVFRKMEKLLRKKNPDSDLLWPTFYGVKGDNEGCLMEDLSEIGFKMVDRKKELDFEHLKLCVESLAKFHAAGAVLLEKGKIEKDMFKPNKPFFVKEENIMRVISRPMSAIPKLIENWSSEWQEYTDKLRNMDSTFLPRLLQLFEEDEYSIKTLNHGDCWSNNILFKYNHNGTPVQIKFLDYQLPYVNSPCFDLHYLLSSNMKLNLIDRKNELLKLYYDSLVSYLELLEYDRKVPTFDELQREFDKTKLFGFYVTIALKAFFVNPSAHELAKKFNITDYKEKFYLPHLYEGEYYSSILKNALKSMSDCGLFEKIDICM